MYRDFFGLKVPPFNNTPDPRFFFSTPEHEEALASLVYAAKARKGFVLVTGEVGAGKTLIARILSRRLEDCADVAVITNTRMLGPSLIACIAQQLGVPVTGNDGAVDIATALEHFLVNQHRRNRLVLLILDEAQSLPLEMFEELRMISNLEADDAKLIQIMILGQPELRHAFLRPDLNQLRQRLFRTFHLSGLTRQQTGDYIRHRITVAGAPQPEDIFDQQAIDRVHEYSRGIPRAVNQLCDNALLSAYAQSKRCITPDMIEEVIAEMLTLQIAQVQSPFPPPTAPVSVSPCRTPTVTLPAAPTEPVLPVIQATRSPTSADSPSLTNSPACLENQQQIQTQARIRETLGLLEKQRCLAEKATDRLSAVVDKAEGLIRRFERVCSDLPKDIPHLEQAHNQLVQSCEDAEQLNAALTQGFQTTREQIAQLARLCDAANHRSGTLARQAERSTELARVVRQIFGRFETQLSDAAKNQTNRLRSIIEQARLQ